MIAGVTAVLALASCGGAESGANPDGESGLEKSELTVGLLPIPDAAAVPLANSKGYFKDEGLSVKVETVQGGAKAIPQLINGSLDVTQSNYVSLFLAREQGNKLLVAADAAQAKPNLFNLMVPKDSPAKKPSDLKGKTIAVNTLKNIGELSVTATLGGHGVSAEEVKYVEYPFPNMAAALKNGDVDAAWITEPFITAGERKFGLRTLADTMTGPTVDFPIAGWVISEDFAKENPKTLAAFQRAVNKGQRLAADDRQAVTDVLPSYTKITEDVAGLIAIPAYPTTVSETRLQRVADLMFQFKYLKQKANAKTVIAAPAG